MKKEDLDALASLYETVYSPAESGEYLTEQLKGFDGKPLPVSAADKKRAENEARFQQRAAAYKAKGGSNYAAYLAGGGNKGRSNMQAGRAGLVAPQDVERQGRANLKAKAAKDAVANASQADKNKAAETVFKLKPGSLTKPAAKPAASPAPAARPAAPAARPAAPGAGAKVAPTAAAKPAGQTGDKAKDMATWAKANPTLANKPKTPNPLMQKTFGYQKGGAPDQVAKTAAATSKAASNLSGTGALATKTSTSTPVAKPAATLPAKRPGGPGTGAMTRGGASGDIGPNARTIRSSYEWGSKATLKDVASLYSSIYEGKKKDQDQDGDTDFADVQIARMIASGMSRAEAIAAVRNKEYNEEFVTEDPVQDFRDMRRAKENAAGLRGSELSNSARPAGSAAQKPQPRSREFEKVLPSGSKPKPSGGGSAAMRTTGPSSPGYDTRRLGGSDLRRLSNSYEFEGSIIDKYIGEAAKRTPKKVRGAKTSDKEWQRGRSDAGKRISGDEDTGPRYYTLGRSRGAEPDSPTAPGARPKNTPKLAGWEKDDIQYRRANLRAGRTHKVGGEKGLPEEYQIYEIVASYLLENNFAETIDDANVIIENMSEVWIAEILENLN